MKAGCNDANMWTGFESAESPSLKHFPAAGPPLELRGAVGLVKKLFPVAAVLCLWKLSRIPRCALVMVPGIMAQLAPPSCKQSVLVGCCPRSFAREVACLNRLANRRGSWSIVHPSLSASVKQVFPVRSSAQVRISSTGAVPEVSWEQQLREKGDAYFANDSRPVILYDGVCNMCNGTVNFVLDRDSEGLFRFAALQSDAGKALLVRSGRPADYLDSVVVAFKDKSYEKTEGIVQVGKLLKLPLADMATSAPLSIRDSLYNAVAQNRYSLFGKSGTCRVSDKRFRERFLE